jgi:hypothetical protein
MTGASSDTLLESLQLGVAYLKVSAEDPHLLLVTSYGGTQEPGTLPVSVSRRLRCAAPASFPGVLDLPEAGLSLSVQPSSPFSYTIQTRRDGRLVAQGLGLTDRDDPAGILVAWWTGETEPYGVVKYSIRDSNTVVGYYISRMTPDHPGEDIAVGDTNNGFVGDFILNSREVSGRTWGPHEWMVSPRGAVTDIAWREHGRIFCRGIGMPHPEDNASIIATYIAI